MGFELREGFMLARQVFLSLEPLYQPYDLNFDKTM
jgi:hypothetical protein